MATDGSLAEARRTERDGIPVLWAEHTGSCVGALLVRSGTADETLRTNGIDHLVEHLALFPIGRPAYAYNGRVEEAVTLFYAEGTPDEVAGFLRSVGEHLAALPVDRLDVERQILLTEESGRETGLEARLLGLRFGPRGYGMQAQPELGLGWLGPDELRAWAAERFTRGNAVAWMSAEPPEDLRIPLPDGPALAPPAPETIPTLTLPTAIEQGTGGVALSLHAARSMELTVGLAVAAERAHDALRRDAGLSYAVSAGYVPLDAGTAHVMLQADCKDHDARKVRDGLLRVLDDLAGHGPTEEELERDMRAYLRSQDEPGSILGTLDYTARDLLLGAPVTTRADLLREREEVTAASVAGRLAEALESLLVLVPVGTSDHDGRRFARYAPETTTPVEGRVHPPTELWTAWKEDSRLTVGPEGVTTTSRSSDEALTVRFADCVGVVPLLSGAVTLVDRSGAWITINPHIYERGDDVIAAVRRALDDPELLVPLTEQERELQPIVAEQLGAELERVPREVDALPGILARDERPGHLAHATYDDRAGLLVLTERRLLFVFIGRENTLIDLPRETVTAEAKGLLRRKRLVVTTPDAVHEFTAVRPPERLESLALALR